MVTVNSLFYDDAFFFPDMMSYLYPTATNKQCKWKNFML